MNGITVPHSMAPVAGLRGVTASFAGLFINLVPVFGIIASYIVLGERLSPDTGSVRSS